MKQMPYKLRILVDMDGVLADLLTPWLAWANDRYGTNYSKMDINQWNIDGMPGFDKGIYAFLAHKNVFRLLKPLEDAKKYLGMLRHQGHEIVIVTASRYGHRDKIEWAKDHFEIESDDIIFAFEKHMVKGDILIDDAPHSIDEFKGLTICMGYGYNTKCNPSYRVNNWSEVYEAIQHVSRIDKYAARQKA